MQHFLGRARIYDMNISWGYVIAYNLPCIIYIMYHITALGLIVSLEGLLFQSSWKINAIFWLMFMAPATSSRGEEAVGIMVKPAEIHMCCSYIF